MRSRRAIAQYEATIVLVIVSLSLASVVYAELRKESSLEPQAVFVNSETQLGGSPAIERLDVNSSGLTTISSMSVDASSSTNGILELGGAGYSVGQSLCAAGETTFFSVLTSQPGAVQVNTNGQAWVAGTWGSAVSVSAGWQEVMIEGGTSCSVTLPGGQVVSSQWQSSPQSLSSIPAQGSLAGTSFVFYLPIAGGEHTVLLTSNGGFDDVSL